MTSRDTQDKQLFLLGAGGEAGHVLLLLIGAGKGLKVPGVPEVTVLTGQGDQRLFSILQNNNTDQYRRSTGPQRIHTGVMTTYKLQRVTDPCLS